MSLIAAPSTESRGGFVWLGEWLVWQLLHCRCCRLDAQTTFFSLFFINVLIRGQKPDLFRDCMYPRYWRYLASFIYVLCAPCGVSRDWSGPPGYWTTISTLRLVLRLILWLERGNCIQPLCYPISVISYTPVTDQYGSVRVKYRDLVRACDSSIYAMKNWF